MTDSTHTDEALTANDYLRPVWRRKWLVLALVILVTGGSYAYSAHKPKQYGASTLVYLQADGSQILTNSASAASNTPRTVADSARLLQTLPVATAVAKQLHYRGSPATLLGDIGVTSDPADDFIKISAQSHDPVFAANLVNAFARSFIQQQASTNLDLAKRALASTEKQLHRLPNTTAAASSRTTLLSTAEALQAEVSLPAANASQVNPASPDYSVIAPNPTRDAIFGFAISLLLGIVAAFGLERVDHRISEVGDLEPLVGTRVLSTVPFSKTLVAVADRAEQGTDDHLREAFQKLRTTLQFSGPAAEAPRSLVVTSAIQSEGKTTVVRNLAFAYAEVGARVAVIDCDLRRPGVGPALALEQTPGLTDVVEGRVTLREGLHDIPLLATRQDDPSSEDAARNGVSGGAHLVGAVSVLTAGTTTDNVPGLLASPRVREILAELKRSYDMLIIDTPPILPVSDAISLMGEVDGVIVVSRVGLTTDEFAEQAVQTVRRVDRAELMGIVANGTKGGTTYGYGYS